MNVFVIGIARKNGSSLLASPYIAKELRLMGFEPEEFAAKDDVRLRQAFQQASKAGGLILVPLTGNAVIDRLISQNAAAACQVPLELHQQAAEQIIRNNHHISHEEAMQMASLPKGARIFSQHSSQVPGYQLNGRNVQIVVLPADAAEQAGIFCSYLFPTFEKHPLRPFVSHTVRVMGLSVRDVEGALQDLIQSEDSCTAVYDFRDEVMVRMSAGSGEQCLSMIRTALERLGGYVYGVDVPNIEQALMQRLDKSGARLALVEYGTTGVSKNRLSRCASAQKNLIYYHLWDKGTNPEELGIPQKLIDKNGIVSVQTAAAAAAAIGSRFPDTIGVSIMVPTAEERSSEACVAASCGRTVLMEKIPISGYQSVHDLIEGCVARALNLARKYADSYPAQPKGAVPMEKALTTESAGPADPGKKGSAAVQTSTAKERNKKPSAGKRFLTALFPQKGDSKSEKARKIAILVCIVVFCCSIGYLMHHHQQGVNAGKETDRLNDMLQQAESGELQVDEEKLAQVEAEVLEKYKPFVALNGDMKGWVKIEDTNISYPVVQAKDNEFYHRKNFDGEYDYYGVPYLDYECSINVDHISDNLIVYGHNIGNDGLMFNPLTYYKKLDFYKTHPVVQFDSIYQEGQYKIFGVFLTNALPEQDNGNVFHYQRYVDFHDEAQFNEFINEVRKRSMWDIDVDVQPGDKLLTLSTCTYDFRPEERCVIVARKVREGEDVKVDTSTAKVNEDAYFPQAYYDAMKEKAKYGKVKGIAIDGPKEYTLQVGDTLQLNAVTTPKDAPINTATWDSSASAVATVNSKNGFVTAVSPGEAVITAMADDGGFVANVKITVTSKNALEYLGLDPSELVMQVGQENKITAVVAPEDAAVNLEWSIDADHADGFINMTVNKSNPRELFINANKGTGNYPVTITVKDTNTGKTAECAVIIKEQANISGIAFQYENYTLQANETKTVQVNVLPQGSLLPAGTQVEWYVTKDGIVELGNPNPPKNPAGAVSNSITGLQPGTTVIGAIVTVNGEDYVAECTVTVGSTNIQIEGLPAAGLTMAPKTVQEIPIAVNPQSAVDQISVVSAQKLARAELYKTRDGSVILEVTAGGKQGMDTLTFMAGGKQIAVLPVTVGEGGGQQPSGELASVTLTPSNHTMQLGAQPLNLQATPNEGAVIAEYYWWSDDKAVAKVDQYGVVTAMGEGTTKIWLEATDAKGKTVEASMTVTVVKGGGGNPNQPSQPEGDEVISVSGPGELYVGERQRLSASSSLGNTEFTWESDDPSVLSVNQNGRVSANGPGTATIVVVSSSGGVGTITITVLDDSGSEDSEDKNDSGDVGFGGNSDVDKKDEEE